MINNSTSVSKPVEWDKPMIHLALTALERKEWHRNSNDIKLTHGDTITQPLNLKGAGASATKSALVRKLRLVTDNTEHIESKINGPNIVILTKYVRKFY